MNLLHENSLGKTLDAINDALFFEKQIPQEEARRTARWIAGRQGLPTSYAGMFAPTIEDYKEGVRLFTGERISLIFLKHKAVVNLSDSERATLREYGFRPSREDPSIEDHDEYPEDTDTNLLVII